MEDIGKVCAPCIPWLTTLTCARFWFDGTLAKPGAAIWYCTGCIDWIYETWLFSKLSTGR